MTILNTDNSVFKLFSYIWIFHSVIFLLLNQKFIFYFLLKETVIYSQLSFNHLSSSNYGLDFRNVTNFILKGLYTKSREKVNKHWIKLTNLT